MDSSSRSSPKSKKNKTVGEHRMDAAIQHLQDFGFEEKIIKSTVKSLLKVYEGAQGWYFLEENNYLLVVEALLKTPDDIEEEQPLPQLPAPPFLPSQEEGEQQQNSVSDVEMDKEEQGNYNGGGSGEEATMVPTEIHFMDEKLLHVIPPGPRRPLLYGYLSETDSDFDVELDADDLHSP